MAEEYTLQEKFKITWDGILRNANKAEKQERLKQYFKVFSVFLHDEIKSKRKNIPEEESFLCFIEKNNVLPTMTSNILKSKQNMALFLEYTSYFLRLLKYNEKLMSDEKLSKEIFKVILALSQQLDNEEKDFAYKNEYALFLNGVTRLILNYPKLISHYKIRKVNPYTHKEYEEYIIFSSLMNLLEVDHLIKTFEYKKYIRRSLIVHLSFDLFINSSYFQNKATFVEILINKLCNYYQMLPTSFDFESRTRTLEAGCNIHLNFHVLCPLYFEFTDYATFLNKITNCFTNENIKKKLKHYFFNKFLIKNVQPYLLSSDPKVSRSHFQYLVSFLHISKNSAMEDVIVDFLFGFSENKIARKFKCLEGNKEKEKDKKGKEKINIEDLFIDKTADFDYANHRPSEISLRIFNGMTQKKEHANVVIYKLFEILFEKRPYLMIKKFVKPFTDFVIKRTKGKSKYNGNKSYPITLQLIELLNFYQKYDTTDMINNVECSMFKNFAYYINYDIDFYQYYSKYEDELMNNLDLTQSTRSNISENSLSVDTLMAGVRKYKKNNNEKDFDQSILSQLEKENVEIEINKDLLNDFESIDEGIQNMYFLFMKNLLEKLMNFFENDNLENIFLTNLLITIISVPCLNFDPDLVQSTAVVLDDDTNSKYSFLTIFRFLCQQILIKLKGDDKRKEQLKKFIKIIFKNNNIINKNKKKKKDDEDEEDEEKEEKGKDKKDNDDDFLIFLLKKDNKDKIETTNFIIFCEFIKEYICSISHKHKFEGLIENLYGLYCEELHESEHIED
jgi:hypothetical protein